MAVALESGSCRSTTAAPASSVITAAADAGSKKHVGANAVAAESFRVMPARKRYAGIESPFGYEMARGSGEVCRDPTPTECRFVP
jgi:hypothetical protein